MEISINNPVKSEIFSLIFQHLKAFTEHIVIMFEKDRVYFQSMDSSRISVFELFIPSTWFDKYVHSREGTFPVGVSSTFLYKVLNTREKSQETRIVFNSEEDDKMYIYFTSEDKSVFDKRFELPLVDIDTDYMAIPDMESNADFSIPSINFANIINQLRLFGDTIDIECTEEKIELKSLSEGTGKMCVDIKIDELSEYSINEGESINLSFSLGMLHNICLYNKISKEVHIKLIKDFPMKIVYNLGDENTKLIFHLAPKMNED